MLYVLYLILSYLYSYPYLSIYYDIVDSSYTSCTSNILLLLVELLIECPVPGLVACVSRVELASLALIASPDWGTLINLLALFLALLP